MTKTLSTVIAVSALALGLAACVQESALNRPPGTYERMTRSTDPSGTTIERRSSADVSVDEYGRKRAVIKSKTTRDPKGWFNKTTTSQSEQDIQQR